MDIYIFLLPLVLCASCIPWNFKMQTFFISLNFHCKQNIANHSCFKLSELKILWHLNESCKQMLTQNFTAQSLREEDMLQICWHKFLPSINLACYGQASRILWNHFGASFYELLILNSENCDSELTGLLHGYTLYRTSSGTRNALSPLITQWNWQR